MCTPLEPLRRVHDSSCSARLLQANFCSIVRTGYSAGCGGISLTCGGMLKRFPRIYGVIDENAFHGRLMRCPYINYSWDKGKRLWRYWRSCIPPQVNEIPPGKNSLRALVIVWTRDQDTRMRLARSLRLRVTWLDIIELIMVIELSGGQFSLKSYAWFQNRTSAQREFDLKSQSGSTNILVIN